mmetsp:Transcript_4249/g.9247  ORF Transcript_4249/g.9247 Transcript_4249/m.9247 type:complete len:633 (+) Transcript_4249:69-1967(+)|eukprot:CAMPEP_0202905150 /NCGR_PEP_ID=MMETSP1392-20130828/32827_1 /ASSEMBLY_ACC=CAM_ASM_000868 /TAXON_ID=225041 /ORGANISM="Chlamydomonas chlamydogama, Strain SAG 11-48b" /LENGTH=632 /DNA_ID=CAMNT_0049593119 /DNA_START=30 /DNA_END=1928 /DNA_ORIENTATION=+
MDTLQREFGSNNFKFKDNDALTQFAQLTEEYGLLPKEVAHQYDTYASLKDHVSFDISAHHAAPFRQYLAKELAKENKGAKNVAMPMKRNLPAKSWEEVEKVEYPTPKRQTTEALNKAKISSLLTTPATIPKAQATTHTPPPSTTPLLSPGTSTKFSHRSNKGQVVSTLNENVVLPARQGDTSKPQQPLQLHVVGEPLVLPGGRHVHMVNGIDARVSAIDERIMDFAAALKAALPLEASEVEVHSVAAVSQEPVWVAGRIVSEAEGGMSLNEQSVLLEGSIEASSGARVRLDLSGLPHFRLFPGQVVCVKGVNPTGDTLVAQQLCTHLPAQRLAPAAAAAAAAACAPAASLSMVVAAGPYTTSEDVSYEPLTELLKYCSDKQADVLVLLGPFVDVEHPAVKDGRVDRTFEQLYKDEILRRVSQWQATSPQAQSCRVALLPAVRDAHAVPAFPQPPLEVPASAAERISSLQNPCTFTARGLMVSASSQDFLKHVSSTELSRGPCPDRLGALSAHVLGQRSFYPLMPAPLGACVDLSHSAQLRLPCTPDVLVIASDLQPFAKVVPVQPQSQAAIPPRAGGAESEVALVINPGRLTKAAAGGTFAHLLLAPAPAAEAEGAASTAVHQRCRVEIRRI